MKCKNINNIYIEFNLKKLKKRYGPPGNEAKFNFGMHLLMSCVKDLFEYFRTNKEFNSDLQWKNSHIDLPHKYFFLIFLIFLLINFQKE